MLELRYEEVARLFTYDREAGILYWRNKNGNNTRRNYVAGSLKGDKNGYQRVGIKGKIYKEHRIIMMLCFGHIPENAEIDHINHVRNDNRLCNLRFVTMSENMRNKSVSSKSTTGVTGVYFYKRLQKYIARIRVNREFIHLGTLETLEDAAEARRQADRKYKFNNNHGKGRAEYVRKKSITRLPK